jgi:cell division transport system permease protein
MNGATVCTIALLLFLFGVSVRSSWQLEQLVSRFGNQVEVAVFLNPGVSSSSLETIVAQFPEVTSVQSVSKDEAWQTLQGELGLPDLADIREQLNGNPLVDELRVRAKTPEVVAALAERLNNLKGVESVQYQVDLVEQLRQLQQGLMNIGSVIIAALFITTIAVINTTIRLILVACRPEIEIMQLVGATRLWICGHFVLQGIGFGLSGGVVAWVTLMAVQQVLQGVLAQQPEFIQFLWRTPTILPWEGLILLVLLLGLGGSVGLLGSLFAVWDLIGQERT